MLIVCCENLPSQFSRLRGSRCTAKHSSSGARQNWVQTCTLLLPSDTALGEFLHLSELPFPRLFKMGRIILYVRCPKNPSYWRQCRESRDQCDPCEATGVVFSQFGPVVSKC